MHVMKKLKIVKWECDENSIAKKLLGWKFETKEHYWVFLRLRWDKGEKKEFLFFWFWNMKHVFTVYLHDFGITWNARGGNK